MEGLVEKKVPLILGKECKKHKTVLTQLQFLKEELPAKQKELNDLTATIHETATRKINQRKTLMEITQQRYVIEKVRGNK